MESDPFHAFPRLAGEVQEFRHKGILPYQQIADLIARGHIRAAQPIPDAQIQPASLDLRLGSVAYQVKASFLPTTTSTILSQVEELRVQTIDLSRPAMLEKGNVYIIPLQEELQLPRGIAAKANPKSTTGRLDVFTRLVAEFTNEFDRVPRGYAGKLYVEVVPHTFSVVVHEGTRLNQLRFGRGAARWSDRRLSALHDDVQLVYGSDGAPGKAEIKEGLWITVDLTAGPTTPAVGYKAKTQAPAIDLDRIGYYDWEACWERIEETPDRQVIIAPGDFYILASREKILVPPDFAAELVAYDPSVGEFRVHYAGFFDPGFGDGLGQAKGTRAVLEVRSHEVPFLLRHGQRVGRFLYESLAARPAKLYGAAIGSSYQGQDLALSKQFKRPAAPVAAMAKQESS